MKRKLLGIMPLAIVSSMMMVSLTGCGTRAKAAEQEVAGEETIIVTDDESSEDTIVNTEDEIAEPEEVVVDATATDGDIVLYDEIGEYPDYLISDFTFELMEKKQVAAVDDIPVYLEEGIKVGHVKGGVTIVLTEHGINSRWYRFENPLKGTDYQYLYMFEDDIPIDESELLTSAEVKEWIIEHISNRDYAIPVFLDDPDSDMEYIEFSIERQGNYGDAGLKINQVLFSHGFDVGDFTASDYSTFCVESRQTHE